MYEYAVRKKYLTENPMNKVQILVKFRQVVRKTGKTETYNSEELAELNTFLDRMYEETLDASLLAFKVNFLLGLRPYNKGTMAEQTYCLQLSTSL